MSSQQEIAERVGLTQQAVALFVREIQETAHGRKIVKSAIARAMRRYGEILLVTPKNIGARGNPGGRGSKNVQSRNGTAQPPKLPGSKLWGETSSRCSRPRRRSGS